MYKVEFYTDKSGNIPFDRWLDSLNSETQVRIEARIDRLKLGNFGDTKPVGEGVHELRLQFGAGYRIYYGNIGKRIILLLSGGDKSSQERDITNAKKFFKDYKDQHKESKRSL